MVWYDIVWYARQLSTQWDENAQFRAENAGKMVVDLLFSWSRLSRLRHIYAGTGLVNVFTVWQGDRSKLRPG